MLSIGIEASSLKGARARSRVPTPGPSRIITALGSTKIDNELAFQYYPVGFEKNPCREFNTRCYPNERKIKILVLSERNLFFPQSRGTLPGQADRRDELILLSFQWNLSGDRQLWDN